VRYSDVVAVDISAVRQGDAPANANPSPHGLYGEQLCQVARFAGMSDKTIVALTTQERSLGNNSFRLLDNPMMPSLPYRHALSISAE
jgi:hypothetical protein